MENLTDRELVFLKETLTAIVTTGARIGKSHYSVTLTRLETIIILKKFGVQLSNFSIAPPCDSPGCENTSESLVHDREDDKVHHYCDYHADLTCYSDRSEYTTHCPNCGCQFSVN